MRRMILTCLIGLIAAPVFAANLTVTVPAAAVVEATQQCERQRVLLRVAASDWDNDICATFMVRLGIRTSLLQEVKAEGKVTVETAVNDASVAGQSTMNDYDEDFPLPATPCSCGDSIVGGCTEFGEDCDDGGESATCNQDCTTSVCGDGKLNVTAGEQCDDGNTDNGDGCDETCQTE